MHKGFILLLMLALLMLACGPASAQVPDVQPKAAGTFSYSANAGGGVTITGYTDTTSPTVLVIPETLDGLPVTRIGQFAINVNTLETVYLPNNLTHIETAAFMMCSSLREVVFGNQLYSIGENAFASLPITRLSFPDSLKLIGKSAFMMCSELSSITFGSGSKLNAIGEGAFTGCTALTGITLPDAIEQVGASAFMGCSALSSVDFGKGLQKIQIGAFNGTALEEVILPDTVTLIEDKAFMGCMKLKKAVLPAGLLAMGENVFFGSADIKLDVVLHVHEGTLGHAYALENGHSYVIIGGSGEIVPPSSAEWTVNSLGQITAYVGSDAELIIPAYVKGQKVLGIGIEVFANHTELKKVVLPEGLTKIGSNAFQYCTALEEVVLPSTLTQISMNAFAYNSALKTISLPDSLSDIGMGAFQYTGLDSIVIPGAVGTLYTDVFKGCTSLKSAEIGEGVTSISVSTFDECTTLETVVLPGSLGTIASYVFDDCTALSTVVIGEGVTKIANWAFEDHTALNSVQLPSTMLSIENSAFKGCTSLKEIVLPEGLMTIGYAAFRDCTAMTNVVFPATATALGEYVFRGCTSLLGVEIPEGITTIPDYAFAECTNLWYVGLPSTLRTIGANAFRDIDALLMEIPNGCTAIGTSAFRNVRELNIKIPASVVSIENSSFYGSQTVNIYVERDSVAHQYFANKGWPYRFYGDPCAHRWVIDSIGQSHCKLCQAQCPHANVYTFSAADYVFFDGEIYQHYIGGSGDFCVDCSCPISLDGCPTMDACSGHPYASAAPHGLIYDASVAGVIVCFEARTNVAPGETMSLHAYSTGETVAVFTDSQAAGRYFYVPDYGFEVRLSGTGDGIAYGYDVLPSVPVPAAVSISDNLRVIKEEAFADTALAHLILPDGCVSIGERAFAGCDDLVLVEIPASVETIAASAFEGCEGLFIRGEEGSAAERYANEQQIAFIAQ